MGDLIDRDEAIKAIEGLNIEEGTPQLVWSSDAVSAIKSVRTRIKSPKYTKLLPCTCGSKRREHWYCDGGIFLKCEKCGKIAPAGAWETDARKNWNAMIEAEMAQKEGQNYADTGTEP